MVWNFAHLCNLGNLPSTYNKSGWLALDFVRRAKMTSLSQNGANLTELPGTVRVERRADLRKTTTCCVTKLRLQVAEKHDWVSIELSKNKLQV